MVDNNIYALVKSGSPTVAELEAARDAINDQYSSAMGDNEYKLYLSLYKEIHVLGAKFKLIFDLVEILRGYPHEGMKAELNNLLGTSFAFDYGDPEKYNKELDRCLNRSKAIKVQIDLKQSSFKSIEERFKDRDFTPTREYFYSVLITLTDHSKVRLDETITVFEFCERVKRLNKYIKEMEVKK